MKKNCHNCKFAAKDCNVENDGVDVIEYFVCRKRINEIDTRRNLEYNLSRPEYLEKSKRCCELKSNVSNLESDIHVILNSL